MPGPDESHGEAPQHIDALDGEWFDSSSIASLSDEVRVQMLTMLTPTLARWQPSDRALPCYVLPSTDAGGSGSQEQELEILFEETSPPVHVEESAEDDRVVEVVSLGREARTNVLVEVGRAPQARPPPSSASSSSTTCDDATRGGGGADEMGGAHGYATEC